MSGASFAESTVEQAALAWLADSGFVVAFGPEIAIGQPGAERSDPTYREVVLEWRLREHCGGGNRRARRRFDAEYESSTWVGSRDVEGDRGAIFTRSMSGAGRQTCASVCTCQTWSAEFRFSLTSLVIGG